MSRPKYGASVDLNQKEIVRALQLIGCDVELIGTPVDLLVGYRAHNFLIECKRPGMENRRDQEHQREWMKKWRGQVRVVTTPEEAIELVTRAYRGPHPDNAQ